MTKEELAVNDGREGRPAWVAVRGKVYDFTESPLWNSGDHQGAHQAGRELTEELLAAPHVRAVIERFPVVGELVTEEPPSAAGSSSRVWVVLGGILLAGILLWLLLR